MHSIASLICFINNMKPGPCNQNIMETQMDSVHESKETSYGGTKTIRSAIKLLSMAIFVGYIMIWILMPTNTFWLHWLPNIQSRVNTTYFGQEGANILIYTFPILFIAVLGCLDIHLGKVDAGHKHKSSAQDSGSALWRKIAVSKGPMGTISWIELAFLSMFLALLLWSFSAYIHGMFANITRQSAIEMKEQVWEVKLDSAGLLLGLMGNICLAFLFFPVTRGSSILRLFGLTSESSIKYHIWLGHITMTLLTAHGLCFAIFWASTNQISKMMKWAKVGISNLAGEVALLSGLVMWLTTFPKIRRKIFELFFYTHYLYIVFIGFYILHVGFSYSFIMLPGFYLFLIDRYLRFLQSQRNVQLVSARVLPCHAVELNFSKSPGSLCSGTALTCNPTSIMFINVPSISKLQWHPFTVTSNTNTDPEKLSIVIKSEGRWSRDLYEKLLIPSTLDRIQVSVEGPYGPTSNHFLSHEKLVMVSGGSGITPFISIIRELLYTSSKSGDNSKQVILIAAFKKAVDLTILDFILPSGNKYDISHCKIQIEAYITREIEPDANNQKQCRTIWFKPSTKDEPVSAILGSNSWLWLGVIITTSFIIFLLIIAFLNRYYIYPIDGNTYLKFSSPLRSILSMLAVLFSILTTATAAFLWTKTRNNGETRQKIQNSDLPTPVTSPGLGSWLHNMDMELESYPHQTLAQNVNVHFGQRPNIRKLISESDGSSIGVLVSGPRNMRHEVAAICSSMNAKNLNFESISFSF